MIKLINVSKSYENEVLHNFSYTFNNGSKYLITGKSGIGKSTLLNIITSLIKPDEGEIITTDSFSYGFQQPILLDYYSVKKNIELFTKNKDINDFLLPKECLNQKVSTLSGGQKQKLSIYIALKAKSDTVILDEPFNNLDEKSIKTILNFINDNLSNRTIIICSHQKDLLQDYILIDLDQYTRYLQN